MSELSHCARGRGSLGVRQPRGELRAGAQTGAEGPAMLPGVFCILVAVPFPNHPKRGKYMGEGGKKGEEKKIKKRKLKES